MEHTIEPELLGPLPRTTVHRDPRILTGNLAFRFLMVLLIGLGIGVFIYFCMNLTLITNPTAEGRITAVKLPDAAAPETGSPEDNIKAAAKNALPVKSPTIEYTFTVSGRDYSGSMAMSQQQFSMIGQADKVKIRFLPLFTELMHRPILPNDTFLGWVGIVGIVTLMSEVAIGTLCWFAFVLPDRQRDLFRIGMPAEGIVTRTEYWGQGGTSCTIYYRFEIKNDPNNPPKVIPGRRKGQRASKVVHKEGLGEMRVTREEADSVNVDDKLTVLYLPDDPDKNVIYKFGMYRAKRGTA